MFSDEAESIEDQLDFLQQFANLASIAIQNAQLIQQKQWELQQSKALADLAEEIAGSASLTELFRVAAQGMIQHFAGTSVDVWTLSDNQPSNCLGAWKLSGDGIVDLPETEQIAELQELKKYLQRYSFSLKKMSAPGQQDSEISDLANFRDKDYSFYLLREVGKPWAVLRLRCTPTGFDNIQTRTFLHSIASHIAVSARLHRMLAKATYEAEHDELTSLRNRASFNQLLEKRTLATKSGKQGFSLLFIDIDGFKQVNDPQGHDAGDRILIEVARRFEKVLAGQHLLARLGGDEFAVIAEVTDPESCAEIAEHLIQAIAEPPAISESSQLGASIGIAHYSSQPVDSGEPLEAAELLKMADEAMYNSKRDGKNTYSFYTNPSQPLRKYG